jgi:hypothetical protein
MFVNWTVQLMRLSLLLVLAAAVVVFVPSGIAHHTTGSGQKAVTVDDVLDDPQHFVGEELTLEGEVDHIFSATMFAMEDDQDLIGDDQILMMSVMPAGAVRTSTGTGTSNQGTNPVPAVEVVELIDGEFREGKLVRATGTIRMFDRAALEREFGTIDFGSASLDEFENEPVLVMGARQFAELQGQRVEQQVVVIPPPAPAPEPEVIEPEIAEPAPEVAPPAPVPEELPAAEPEPTFEEEEALPQTATPLPAIGLAGLLSVLAGLGIRRFRN